MRFTITTLYVIIASTTVVLMSNKKYSKEFKLKLIKEHEDTTILRNISDERVLEKSSAAM